MSKVKTAFFCNNCGTQSSKWVGKCPACGEWNTFEQEVIERDKSIVNVSGTKKVSKATLLTEIEYVSENRIDTSNIEFNRVLGGGLVPGSIVLIGGEPGIGKSTLALQIALYINNCKILYVSGEESLQQIKMRSERLGTGENECLILSETKLENVLLNAKQVVPQLLIIDSIQTIYTENIDSSPGSVSQIKECALQLMNFCKENSIPAILIGHINKEGNLAGPKVLEHIVDTVLQFEGDRNHIYRILRSIKNRFGSTSELGIFEMHGAGLREVNNPSELLLSQTDELSSGVSVSASIEGVRPFLIEVQALVSTAAYGMPQRTSTGFDLRRLSMLLAVLEKRAGFRLAQKDVFLNIAGGIKVDDTAIDLAVVCSILSSDLDISISKDVCFAGEIGLSGEVRPVTRIEQRIGEASKLGFKKIFISKYNKETQEFSDKTIKIIRVAKVEEVFKAMF